MQPNRVCPHCGAIDETHRPRSPKHHRAFFAAISTAYDNWPEKHTLRPTSAEHLRAWALVECGHSEVLTQNQDATDDISAVLEFALQVLRLLKSRGQYGFATFAKGGFSLFFPKSINCRDVDQAAFKPIADAVIELLSVETGIPVDELIKERHVA